MTDKDTWEDEEEEWPFDEEGEFIEDELIDDWDKIDEVGDYERIDNDRPY